MTNSLRHYGLVIGHSQSGMVWSLVIQWNCAFGGTFDLTRVFFHFCFKTGLQTGARMANLRALLTNLWQ
ncbi:MAG: hypothetical protein ACLPYZ_12085 [Limisphaerales bacterium]